MSDTALLATIGSFVKHQRVGQNIYAEETKVNADLRDAISKTLINLDN